MFYFADIEASEKTKEHYRFDYTNDVYRGPFVGPFEKINIFVGRNNSGKSRFLRELFCCAYMVGSVPSNSPAFRSLEYVESQRRIEVSIYNNGPKVNRENITRIGIDDFVRVLFCRRFVQYVEQGWVCFELNRIPDLEEKNIPDACFEKRFYVPMIRGMRPFVNTEDVYRSRTDIDYFQDETERILNKINNVGIDDSDDAYQSKVGPRILTGLGIYADLKKRLLGKYTERRKVDRYAKWLEEHFFDGQTIEVIADEEKQVVSLTIDHNQEHYIYDWGDGMQNLLILTYWPFMHDDGFFFIEEPDVSFHPSMQRKLLEAYTSEELSGCQFFMTTHSNHLINVASVEEHVGVFTFQKEFAGDAKVVIRKIDARDRAPLLLLGAQPSSIMMSNCTIWVEGISDRLTLKHFLSLYFKWLGEKRLKEDLHYIFMEYSGGNLKHWSFVSDEGINVDYLCSVAFLVADRDGYECIDGSYKVLKDDKWVSDKKSERLDALTKRLDERAYVLPVREFENLHQPEFIESFVLSYPEMKDYQNKTDEHEAFAFDDARKDKWAHEYLGTLIHEQFEALGYPASVNKFAGEKEVELPNDKGELVKQKRRRGTISSGPKTEMPKHAKVYYKHFNDLSEDAKDLVRSIYQFIAAKNGIELMPESESTI